jgi:CubicO group peptidase (beta-lactamase class C family)
MIDVDAGFIQGEMNYSAVWVDNSEALDWVEWRDMTSEEFAEKFDQYEDLYRMIDVESYKVGDAQYYAGIWVENKNGRGWYEYRDMSAKGFGDKWLELRDAGYRLIDYEVYSYGDGYRYAGIWRQNSERPNWPLKATVDALGLVESILNAVPGMSIAIAQNGTIVYLKGFGYADVDDEIIAHSGTLFRLASVSKAVGGTLSMELQEEGLWDISDLSSDHIPGLPDHHTHTVGQTISNRSGIGHYDTYPDIEGDFGTALVPTTLLWNTPLVANPGSMYIYSTHAYTFLGASMEGAVGDPIGTVFEDHLRVPYNLNTLNLEDRSVPNKFRAALYDTDNDEVEADDLSWKVLGGGLESSAYDLLRFGMQLLNGTILDQASLDLMWNAPDNLSNYAFGWNTGTHKGSVVVAKDGAQNGARSYMRIYPDDEIVIVILTNRKEGGHSPSALAKTIGALMLDAAAVQDLDGMELQPLAEAIEEPLDEGQDPAEVIWPVSNPTATPTPQDLEEPPGEAYIAEALFIPFVVKP